MSEKLNDKLYNVGVYIRLSKENSGRTDNDAVSIETQQIMLSKFVDMMPGWIETRTYIDNGASGGNFDRQGFQDMMTDIRNGVINLVLVKDLSRFGRNYLEAGRYLEEELPSLGCRFVALSDGIDTETGENDIMPFLNAMNDHYLKSMSEKIKASFLIKAQNGQRPLGIAPFGYMKSPADKSKLVIDETAAKMVRRIFEMRAEGMGYNAITAVLNNENVPPPRLYYYQRQNREPQANCQKDWQTYTLRRLLTDEQYLGHMIFGKTRSTSYRNTKLVPRDADEWIRVPNAHEAIIEIELWNKVQALNTERRQPTANARKPTPSLFSGKLICSDCQTKLVYHANHLSRTQGNNKYNAYHCRTHMATGGSRCTSHRIYEVALKELLLNDIKNHTAMIQLDEKQILSALHSKLVGMYSDTNGISSKEKRKLKQELHEIELKTEALYESKVLGAITAERFLELSGVSESRRKEIQDLLDTAEQSSQETKAKLADIDRWIRLIKENSHITEVDRDLIDALIDKIVIGEKVKEGGITTQDVRIFYRYVGLV